MPATGYTLPDMASDLEALLDHLEIESAHIVGHSFGARVALYFATTRQNRVKTLTAADTQVSSLQNQIRLGDWPHWKIWKKQLKEQGLDSFPPDDEYINFQMLAHFNKFSDEFANGGLNRKRLTPSLRRRDMGNRGAIRWEKLMSTTSAHKDFQDDHQITIDDLRQINVPTLALFGEYSHCMATCQQLNSHIQTCKVKILREVGHFLPAIKPRLFMRTLRQFVSQSGDELAIRREMKNREKEQRSSRTDHSIQYPLIDQHGDLVLFDRRKPLYNATVISN
jgi:pimeloyl-ACP methyl ester carboxylesterase